MQISLVLSSLVWISSLIFDEKHKMLVSGEGWLLLYVAFTQRMKMLIFPRCMFGGEKALF